MDYSDITELSATALAWRISAGELSAADVIAAHISRVETVNPALNAVVVKRYEQARHEAREADLRRLRGEPLPPLHGVPVTVMESFDLADTPTTFGLPSRREHRAKLDAACVARLRHAGAIVLGKTNVAQCQLYAEADNPVYSRSHNPWDRERTPGGSGGGEAAIIAAGGSALGLAADISGGLRLPAAFCGIAGLMPTQGRLPEPVHGGLPVGQRRITSQTGVLARRVDDLALGLKALIGGDHAPHIPLANYQAVDLSRLRVGYYLNDGTMEPGDAACRAVRDAVDMLRDTGATVIEWTPLQVPLALQLYQALLWADGGAGLRRILDKEQPMPQARAWLRMAAQRSYRLRLPWHKRPHYQGLESLKLLLADAGRRDTDHYWQLIEAQIDYKNRFLETLNFARGGLLDVVIGPASALPAFRHGASQELHTAGAYTPLYNLLGLPAGVVPVTKVRSNEQDMRVPTPDHIVQTARATEQGSMGLPVGVQVAARPWQEHVALAVMRLIEGESRNRPNYPHTPLDPR